MRSALILATFALAAFAAPLPADDVQGTSIDARYIRNYGDGTTLNSRDAEVGRDIIVNEKKREPVPGNGGRVYKTREPVPGNGGRVYKTREPAPGNGGRVYKTREPTPGNGGRVYKTREPAPGNGGRVYKTREPTPGNGGRVYKTREPTMREYKAREEDVQEQEVEAEVEVDTRSLYDEEDTAKLDFIE